MDAKQFIELFPGLGTEVYGKRLVYFDNAATSQRPESVVKCCVEAAVSHNANTHRAVHSLSAQATDLYEASRDAVKTFINARSRQEVVFTSGTTAGINLVAYSFGERFVGKGDEIIVGVAEHHSDMVPWQLLAQRKGASVKYLPLAEDGRYSVRALKEMLGQRTRIVCVGHASNVLGLLNPIKEIIDAAHEAGVPVLVDGAQGAVHTKVDVQALDCDFYAFSMHKLYGPTGVGVLYGKSRYLEEMPPFLSGGEMVGNVSFNGTTFAPLPLKFEAGTPNFNAVAAVVPALEVAETALTDKQLNEQMERTKCKLYKALMEFAGLHLHGSAEDLSLKLPVFSFVVDGVHHEDLAQVLDKMGIAVRSGQMCAEPLMGLCGTTGMTRVSLLPYNTEDEVDYFMKSLERAVNMVKQ